MQKLFYCLGIVQTLITVYHPRANMVERKNRDLKSILATLVGQPYILTRQSAKYSVCNEYSHVIQYRVLADLPHQGLGAPLPRRYLTGPAINFPVR